MQHYESPNRWQPTGSDIIDPGLPAPRHNRSYRQSGQESLALFLEIRQRPYLVLSAETVTRGRVAGGVVFSVLGMLVLSALIWLPLLGLAKEAGVEPEAMIVIPLWLITAGILEAWIRHTCGTQPEPGPGGWRRWTVLRFDPPALEDGEVKYSWRGVGTAAVRTVDLRDHVVFAGCVRDPEEPGARAVIGLAETGALEEGFPRRFIRVYEESCSGFWGPTGEAETKLRPLANELCRSTGLPYRVIWTVGNH